MELLKEKVAFEMMLFGVAFLVSMALTPIYTYLAYKYKWWKKQKKIAVTGEKLTVIQKLHAKKIARHFPTMAGIIGIVAVVGVSLVFNFDRGQTWLLVASFGFGGLIGFIDDAINIFGNGKGAAGLKSSVKFTLLLGLGVWLGWFFAVKLGWTLVWVPFIGEFDIGIIGMIALFAFAVLATSNAVNISDGLDGLAGGLSAIAYAAFGAIALFQEQFLIAGFCFTVVGWLFSYIWFNVYPARFMMGDTGSIALGAGLGVVAMMTDTFLLLPIIGIVFVIEAGSSLLQIFSKKVFKRKIFIAAPIHHHFEAKGWNESKVTMRFWIIGMAGAMAGVFLAIGGGLF